jgi:hypothetical protein
MLQIHKYRPFFIKNSFNLVNKPIRKKKKICSNKDELFYIFFKKIHNLDETTINNYNEHQEKTTIASGIDKIKIKNKEYILNNLMFEPKINLIVLNAICIHYKINLYYIKDNVCVNMCNTPENSKILVMNNNNMFLSFNKNILDELYEIINLDKPLFSLSYYKLIDLINIATKIQLPYEKIKKKDLYDSIYNYLVKLNIFKID